MIHLIITGHGEMATGLMSGLTVLAGACKNCHVVDFKEGMTAEALEEALKERVQEIGDQPILFLTDILGGTPFRTCAALARIRPNREVISGVNLHLLLEAEMERQNTPLHQLTQELIESAREGITSLSQRLGSASSKPKSSTDGI